MKYLKLIIILLAGLALHNEASAQDGLILSDIRRSEGMEGIIHSVNDGNNRKCALIKIETRIEGLTKESFNLGNFAEVCRLEKKPAELWIWVTAGASRIRVNHNTYGTSRVVEFPNLEPAGTYTMKLDVSGTQPNPTDLREQFLTFKIQPENAILTVNGEIWHSREPGDYQRMVPFGEYSWNVTLDGYHADSGIEVVDNAMERKDVKVSLDPAFGFLSIPSTADSRDAEVYIDEAPIGKIPIENHQLSSGEHTLLITKMYYENHQESIIIDDGDTLTVSPALISNRAMPTFVIDDESELYIDGRFMGKGT